MSDPSISGTAVVYQLENRAGNKPNVEIRTRKNRLVYAREKKLFGITMSFSDIKDKR